jgi:hypothetical protein
MRRNAVSLRGRRIDDDTIEVDEGLLLVFSEGGNAAHVIIDTLRSNWAVPQIERAVRDATDLDVQVDTRAWHHERDWSSAPLIWVRENPERNTNRLELGPGIVDEKASASLPRIKLRAKYHPSDLSGAILSAGYYAKKLGHTMYVYEGTSYMHIVYRVSDRPTEYLNPINNSGAMVASVSPDLVVSKHDVLR